MKKHGHLSFFLAQDPTKESGDFVVHLPAEWWGWEGRAPPIQPLLKSTNHSIVVAQSALLSCQCKRRGHRDEWHTGWSHHLANHVGTLYQDSIITPGLLNLDKTYRGGQGTRGDWRRRIIPVVHVKWRFKSWISFQTKVQFPNQLQDLIESIPERNHRKMLHF